jgi:uncharacterized delta-60 repeat protein
MNMHHQIKTPRIAIMLLATALFAVGHLHSQVLDPSFNSNISNGQVNCVLPLPDGKIMIGGMFTAFIYPGVGGVTQPYLARLHEDGSRDDSFTTVLEAHSIAEGVDVYDIEMQADGKILVCGAFKGAYSGIGANRKFLERSNIVRLNADGTVDESFNVSLNGGVHDVELQADGKIVISGYFTSVNGTTQRFVARLEGNGTSDASFISPLLNNSSLGYGYVNGLLIAPGNKIWVLGAFSIGTHGDGFRLVARLNDNGSHDESFQSPAINVTSFTQDSRGRLIVGYYTGSQSKIAALSESGSLDDSYGMSLGGAIRVLAPAKEGGVYAGGGFIAAEGSERSKLVKLNSGGVVSQSFIASSFSEPLSASDAYVTTIALDTQNRLLIGGNFRKYNGATSRYLLRLLMPGPSIAIQPQDQNAFYGDTVTFTISAEGEGSLSYQWLKNGQALEGAQSSSLSLQRVSYADSGEYSVLVTDPNGEIESSSAALTVSNPIPTVAIDPSGEVFVQATGAITLSAITEGGLPPFTYQWRKDGRVIAKENGAELELLDFQQSKSGLYDVIVRNSRGTAISNRVKLSVETAVDFSSWVEVIERSIGDSAEFSVVAPGSTFQWIKDGKKIKGQNGNTLIVPISSMAAAGVYSVIITTTSGQFVSPPAQLRISDSALLVYSMKGTAVAYAGTESQSAPVSGFMVLDRATQKAGLVIMSKTGTITAHRVEIHEEVSVKSTGPVPQSRTTVSELVNGELALWFSGKDTLLKITPSDNTIAPIMMRGFINSISTNDTMRIEEANITLTLDRKNSDQARQAGESLEVALERISQELQSKGSPVLD